MKGSLVFLDYDQAELDAAYDQNVYAPNREQIHRRNMANSTAALERIGKPERCSYGPTPVEYLDVFRTRAANAPIFVFIHGGAWRSTTVERYYFAAEPFLQAGANVVIVQFTGVEEAGGSLAVLAHQVRSAVAWVYKNAASIGGDRERITVAGHSSGAHLTGVVLVTDWAAYGVPDDVVKNGLCCSGMYELAPVRLSKRSSYVAFDDATVEALSTQRHLAKISASVVVAYGDCETPEFQRQGREFAEALRAAGKPVRAILGEGYNHFELIETLGNPYGLIGHAALTLMGLETEGRGRA
jgi:arylformamidase